jgi:hypothetical protein
MVYDEKLIDMTTIGLAPWTETCKLTKMVDKKYNKND